MRQGPGVTSGLGGRGDLRRYARGLYYVGDKWHKSTVK